MAECVYAVQHNSSQAGEDWERSDDSELYESVKELLNDVGSLQGHEYRIVQIPLKDVQKVIE